MLLKKKVQKIAALVSAFLMTFSSGMIGNVLISVNIYANDDINSTDGYISNENEQSDNITVQTSDYEDTVNSIADTLRQQDDNTISRVENTGNMSLISEQNTFDTDGNKEKNQYTI